MEAYWNKLKAKYMCGQLEMGENQTMHLQFFVNFSQPVRITRITKVDKTIHAEKVKVNNGADAYCMKEDTRVEGPWEFGVRPIKRNDATDWERVRTLAKQNQLEDIPADIFVRHYGNLSKIAKDNLQIEDGEELRGHWYVGPSGTGKSSTARKEFPNFYPKLCNKWWDGYKGEPAVIMDDVGLDHKCLGQQLKIWTDRYGCILETKGGAITDKYQTFVVTSQYTIEDIWHGDDATIDALRRRFRLRYFDQGSTGGDAQVINP